MATLAVSLSGSGLATTNGSRNFTITDADITKLVAPDRPGRLKEPNNASKLYNL